MQGKIMAAVTASNCHVAPLNAHAFARVLEADWKHKQALPYLPETLSALLNIQAVSNGRR